MYYSRQHVTDVLVGVADRGLSPAVSRGLDDLLLSYAADVFGWEAETLHQCPLLNTLRRCNMAPPGGVSGSRIKVRWGPIHHCPRLPLHLV